MCDVSNQPPVLPAWDMLLAEIWVRTHDLQAEIELWLSGYDPRKMECERDFYRIGNSVDGHPTTRTLDFPEGVTRGAVGSIGWLREYMSPSEGTVFDKSGGISHSELLEMLQVCHALKSRAEDAYRKMHQSPVRAPDRPPVRANTSVVFSGQEPTADVKDLAFHLARRNGKSEKQIACEFTGGNERKAQSLLAQIRRLKSKGRIVFAPC